MICCCALAGTAACKNCNRRAEFEYPQYVIDYSKTNPFILQQDSNKITALEHAIEILNDKIEILESNSDKYSIAKEAQIEIKFSVLEDVMKILNDKIDKLSAKLEVDVEEYVSSDSFPEKPYEGQYWEVGKKLFRYLDDVWVRLC